MTDVFVTTIIGERIRYHLFNTVFWRWAIEPLCRLITFIGTDKSLPESGYEKIVREETAWREKGDLQYYLRSRYFQADRRIIADKLAESEVYIVADDDCMPIGVDFVARGLEVMAAHPEFGILAAMNYQNRSDIEPYTGKFIDGDVWECHAVGGIRFCRKGIIKKWPDYDFSGSYDCCHHEALVNAGYRSGYMRNVQMNHLGIGLSQHWPEVSEIEELYKNQKVTA